VSDINTTRPSKKLAHKWLGPYTIERPVGRMAYQLRLPRSMQRLHPVFPVVKLYPAPKDPIPGRCQAPPPEPEIIGGEQRWEVEAILDSRMWNRKLQYLVAWKGFGYEENSWEDEKDVEAPALVKEFYRKHPGAPRRIRTIQFGQLSFRVARADTSPRGGGSVRGHPVLNRSRPWTTARSSDVGPIGLRSGSGQIPIGSRPSPFSQLLVSPLGP
jgi:hypothetical protein